jgi:septal ring factor EnvC (AmiA/AmiB activator)
VRVRFAAEEKQKRDGGRDSSGRRRSTSDGESNATELERQKLTTFLPVAGRWYDAFGEAPAPEV